MAKIQLKKIKLPSFIHLLKNKKAYILVLIAILVIGAVVVANRPDNSDKASKKENQEISKKVDSVNNPNVSCEQAIKEIGDISPERYDQETQKKLLLQQLNCYSEQRDYDKVVSTAYKLKDLYFKEADKQGVDEMDMIIKNTEENKLILEQDEKNFVTQPQQ